MTYQSSDGRFAVVQAAPDRGGSPVALVGQLGAVAPGETLRAHGRFETHRTHGVRFVVESYLPVLPSTEDGLERFLGSGLVPGVGPSTAKRIVERFGTRTLDVISQQSAKLLEVSGIGKKRVAELQRVVRARRLEAEQMAFLRSVGLGPGMAQRVLKKFEERTTHQLKEDPYLIAEQVDGIGFATADEVGRALGIGPEDPRRVAGAILHLLGQAADEGHVFLPKEELVTRASSLNVDGMHVAPQLESLNARGLVVIDGDRVYAPPLHRAEVSLAERLQKLDAPTTWSTAGSSRALASPEETSPEQRSAVETTLRHRLTLLTGGPGTGKTTTVKAIVNTHLAMERTVVLCAPTGRAAKRMMEATGFEAKTIHRLLEWTPFARGSSSRFLRGPDAPLNADLVLVDEASMLDLRLAEHLVSALAPGTSLVLVGDVDQLPPVGAGHVLREILNAGVGKRIHLNIIFRQAQKSAIVQTAHGLLSGAPPTLSTDAKPGRGDLFMLEASDPERMVERLFASLTRIEKSYGLDPKTQVQVLTPMRKGPLGTEQLNRALQARLTRTPERGPFVAGDRVMQLKNDYEKDVYNGDMGTVTSIDGDIIYVAMDSGVVSYKEREATALSLAYASTIHKVQGSEFPAVVVLLHSSHHVLLNRALLYTAITRARDLVLIIAGKKPLARAIRNTASHHTHCALGERITQRG